MGGFGSIISSGDFQAGIRGLSTGIQTGTGIAHAEYNAAAMRMQAQSIEQQSDLTAFLLRKQYQSEYEVMKDNQDRQMSYNRVLAVTKGITGGSAVETMGSYAAKAQRNLDLLYYNFAMKTGQMSLQASAQASALNEKARQYDFQATTTLIGGITSLGGTLLGEYGRQLQGSEQKPYASLEPSTTYTPPELPDLDKPLDLSMPSFTSSIPSYTAGTLPSLR